MLLLLVTAGAAMFLGAQRSAQELRSERALVDAREIAAARDALVAYALAGGSGTPGALPCPDMNGDGAANNLACQVAGPDPDVWIGRLPQSTLGLAPDDPSADEALWYALDDDFLDLNTTVNPASEPSLAIGNDPQRYAALLIAAGDPVSGQVARRSNDMADYLEGENNIEGPDSTSETIFEHCDTEDCNDAVLGITAQALLELVQQRIAAELEYPFAQFLDTHGYLPYAQSFDGACEAPSDLEGLVPVATSDCDAGDRLDEDDFPSWIPDNDWHEHLVYRVDDACAGSVPCSTGDLQVMTRDEVIDDLTVVIGLAGVPLEGQERAGSPTIADYLEGDENHDGDDRYHDGHDTDESNDLFRWR